nr:integrase, catalytic region, zinc finger, CCHC-type, peptidase aspartic, catalytic [Tanacetum cinerariifolium]
GTPSTGSGNLYCQWELSPGSGNALCILFPTYNTLEKHCITLEVNNQLNTEIFQRDTWSSQESAPTFAKLFEINNLKAQAQAKDTVILKLKEKLNSINGNVKDSNTYKQLYDSIKSLRVRSKEQCDDLINKVNLKSADVSDSNASLQEKVLVITALKEQLNKLKGKAILTKAVSLNPIDPELLKVDVTPLVPKLRFGKHKKAKKNKVEDHFRTVKSSLNKESVVDSKANSSVINSVTNVNSDLKCAVCNGCLFSDNHDACAVDYINSVNTSKKSKSIKTPVKRKVWKTTGKVFKTVGHIWKPTGRTFTLVGNVCPLTRIATPTIVPPREPIPIVDSTDKPVVTLVYSRKPKTKKISNKMEPNNSWGSSSSNVPSSLFACSTVKFGNDYVAKIMGYGDYQIGNVTISQVVVTLVVQIVLWYLDSGCSKHMTRDRSQLVNFVQKFLSTVKFGNDYVAKIMGYGDYQIGNVTISQVYYVEGLGHNLFSVGQFCNSDMEVAFRQHTCFIRNLDGVDMLTGSRRNNMYTLSIQDMIVSSPICLLSKESKTKSWLWHQVGISHETSVARSLRQNRVVERRNRTLIEAARTMLIYAQAPLFLWAEAVATACFTQNHYIIRLRHGKTPYELLHNKLPDLLFFHVFGALCYPTNDSENLGLVPTTSPSTSYVSPSRND